MSIWFLRKKQDTVSGLAAFVIYVGQVIFMDGE